MSGRVVAIEEGPIGFLVFDHQERRNAISVAMWRGIPDALEQLVAAPGVRVIVLRGAGDVAFISGADISEFATSRSGGSVADYDIDSAAAFLALTECEKPVLAMIHGYCIGGGLALALTADVRVASEEASFAIPAARLGVGYPMPGVEALVQLVGPSAAKEIFFTARRFSATEARERGLVNTVTPKADLEATVRELATRIAENAPLTLRSVKLTVREIGKPVEARDYGRVNASIAACFGSEDYMEGIRAFLEKRKPEFGGR